MDNELDFEFLVHACETQKECATLALLLGHSVINYVSHEMDVKTKNDFLSKAKFALNLLEIKRPTLPRDRTPQ